ncbi:MULTISPECIES: hypothetical protein [unclassified Frankia]|uniref:hypothetical protein n=1 Tax=unclassified Frankia TaxID=2632575 RepID=UPI0008DA2DA9|nr:MULTISPECIES: hypothetical protein [unclassified Frankia]OHV47643.1 hypothetical protein CgIS1_06545 [Frankia sp. CgIS1]
MAQIVETTAGEQPSAKLGPRIEDDRQRLGECEEIPAAYPVRAHDPHRVAGVLPADVDVPVAGGLPVEVPDRYLGRTDGRGDLHCAQQAGPLRDDVHVPGHVFRVQVAPVWPREDQVAELRRDAVFVRQRAVVPRQANIGALLLLGDLPGEQAVDCARVDIDLVLAA